jgi:hypothetical protein
MLKREGVGIGVRDNWIIPVVSIGSKKGGKEISFLLGGWCNMVGGGVRKGGNWGLTEVGGNIGEEGPEWLTRRIIDQAITFGPNKGTFGTTNDHFGLVTDANEVRTR